MRNTTLKCHGYGKKAVSAAAVLAMAATMMVGAPVTAANAAGETVNTVTTDTAVTASVTPASQTAVQMLGLSGIEEPTLGSPSKLDLNNWAGSAYTASDGKKGSLKVILDGQTEYAASVDPYIYNTLNNLTPSNVYANVHMGSYAKGVKMPKSALAEIGLNDNVNAVWKLLPDVLVGTWMTSTGDQTDYRGLFNNNSVNIINGTATKEGVEPFGDGKYDPEAVDYNSDTMATIIDSTYRIAEAAKLTVTKSNGTKALRYGDENSAIDIATTYEEFIKGSQGYVLYRLAQDGKDKKTVAFVKASEETSAGTVFTLTQPMEAASSAMENRAVESLKNVCNIMAGDANNQATVSDLASADLIVIDPSLGAGSNQTPLVDQLGSLKDKTYWTSSAAGSAQGTTYDIMRNNTEIGQNYARLIACAYPEYLDQSDMVAFWYDNFLHVKTDKLGTVISQAMSGVRNWENTAQGVDYTTWTEKSVADYNESTVTTKIEIGCAYLQTWSDDQFTQGYAELLKPTSYIPALSLPAAAGKTAIKTLKAGKKKFTVAYKKVAAATGYQVTYSLKKNFKSATTKTVKKAATTKLTVKKLKSSKKYFVKVRTYKTIDGKTYYSGWSAKKAVKVK